MNIFTAGAFRWNKISQLNSPAYASNGMSR